LCVWLICICTLFVRVVTLYSSLHSFDFAKVRKNLDLAKFQIETNRNLQKNGGGGKKEKIMTENSKKMRNFAKKYRNEKRKYTHTN